MGCYLVAFVSCSLVQQASPEEFFAFLDSESRRQESQGMHVASFPYSKRPNALERHEGSKHDIWLAISIYTLGL